MGYHKKEIQKGIYGQSSKIKEEFDEFMDAIEQNNPIMGLIELSDMIGAIEAYLKNFNISIDQLIEMSNATKRAFEDGSRK